MLVPHLIVALGENWSARVWPDAVINGFPELTIPDILRRPPTAVISSSALLPRPSTRLISFFLQACFSGGGARSYSCTLGQLHALQELALLNTTRHIGGISGGAWATAVFMMYRRGAPGVAKNDQELLGELIPPQNETIEGLNKMLPTCARAAPQTDIYGLIAKYVVSRKAS